MGNPQQSLVQSFLTGKIGRRAFINRAVGLGVSLASVEAFVAACGGGSGSGGSGSSITWSNWANTGELVRFKAFTDDYNKKHNTNVNYSYIPSANNNYFTKITTELNGGNAPDVFYVGDGDIAKLVANQTVMQLNDLLSSSKSQESADDYLPGLWGAAKTKSGKIFGVPVDCNPLLLWYNKKVLTDAGIKDMPTDLYDQNKWTREAFQEMIQKIHANGKQGYILDTGTTQYWAWCTSNGGKLYDNNNYGNFIVQDDPKSLDAMKWLVDQVRQKNIIYAGTLAKGQGSDLNFIGNQVGFIALGRWDLPEFKSAGGLQFDCVPYPSPSGTIAPAPVALAYMVINKKTKLQAQAFDFLTNFVSAAGQTFRLQGGGNAVPSIKSADAEKVVTEGNIPAHAKFLLDARNIGYGLPPAEGSAPALSDDIKTALDPVFLQGKDLTTALASIATMANPRIKAAQEKLQ